MNLTLVLVEPFYLMPRNESCSASQAVIKRNASGYNLNVNIIMTTLEWIILVIMGKNIQIILVQSTITMIQHLVISKIKFLLLVDGQQTPIKLNYLISIQINGRRKLPFLTAQLGEFTI